MGRKGNLVKNMAILSLGTVVPKIASFITLPIITACLTKTEYGTYDLITVLVSLVLPVVTLQMQGAAFRFLISTRGDGREQKIVVTNISSFIVGVSACALAVLYVCFREIDNPIRICIIVYLGVDICLTTARQIARGLAKNMAYSVSALVNALIEMILVAVLLKGYHKGLTGLMCALIFSQLLSLVYLVVSARILSYIDFSLISAEKIKEFLSYSWPLVPNSLSSWVIRVSDRFIISLFLGIEANAIYAVANKLPNIFSIAQSTFTLSWQENASVAAADKDSAEYYGEVFSDIYNLFIGMMALLIASTPIIFKILIRGDYEEAYNHMVILYFGVLFSSISSYLGGIYIANMKTRQIGITTLIAAGINFIINILLVKRIGIYAATLSTVVSYLWLVLYRMIDIQKILKIRFHYIRIILLLLIIVVMALLCFSRVWLLDLVNAGIGAITFTALNWKMLAGIFVSLKNRRKLQKN